MLDGEVIDVGVKSIVDFGKDDLVPHFIYCGLQYNSGSDSDEWFRKIFLTKMRSYEIRYAILTKLNMFRDSLVTKETVKKAYLGKLKNDVNWVDYEMSINDDLEMLFVNLQDRKEIQNEEVASFFTPKLTEEELKLVEERDEQHLSTYLQYYGGYGNPDVDAEEMKKSDSRSKFVKAACFRKTIILELESNQKQATDNKNEMH